MYLLKLYGHSSYFQNYNNLHSTMYLLKLYEVSTSDEQLANLHSTMYLLKHVVLNDIILIS